MDSNGSREEIASSLRTALGDAESAAVAIPGPFNYSSGVFLMKHKFASVYGESFADLVGRPGMRLRFIHDVNAMLLGEMSCGAGVGFDRVALVTLGTGLGFSMSLDGEILKNGNGSPSVSIFNRPYRDGVLEDYASKRGVLALYRIESGSDALTVKDIADLAFAGNAPAAATFNCVGRILGEVLGPILTQYGIECLLFGGQISRSFDLFAPAIRDTLTPATLLRLAPVSDISNATFHGLRTLL